jgi:CHAT domain-containing protein/Tfp pilus assembly protein PilF
MTRIGSADAKGGSMPRTGTSWAYAAVVALVVVALCASAQAQSDEATELNKRAIELYRAGKTGEAIPLARRALEMYEAALPAGHPYIATGLNNLAFLYREQGRLTEAEPLYKRALEMREAALPVGHPDIARSINNLASLYQAQGRLTEAEPLYKRALEMREAALPAGHPDIALNLNNLANLYQTQGRLSDAEPLYKRALEMREAALPDGHPDIARGLSNLANLFQAQGRLTEAEPLYKRALEMREAALPAGHPDISGILNNLASLHYARRDWAAAADHARRASTIVVERARRASGSKEVGSADAARRELADRFHGDPFGWLMAAVWPLAEQQPALRPALSEETFIAAQWADQTSAGAALAQMASRFAKGEGELSRLVREQQNLLNQWQQLDKQVVATRALPAQRRNAAAEAALGTRLDETDRQRLALNARLAHDFPEYAALAAPEPLSFKDTQAQLGPDEALVLFAFAGREGFAWVVTRERARWVGLGDTTANIRAEVQALRCGLDRDGEWDWAQDKQRWLARKPVCAKFKPDGLTADELPPFDLGVAHRLYEALFGPIKDDIKGKQLLVVPSDALTSLPLQVLVTLKPDIAIPGDAAVYSTAAWLGRTHAMAMLPSVASLRSLRAAAGKSPAAKPYIGFGNPLFTGPDGTDRSAWDKLTCAKSAEQQVASAHELRGTFRSLFRGGLGDVEEVRRQNPLPDTAVELCTVASDLKAPESDVYLGDRASERTVKSLSRDGELKRHGIVHFATHGLMAGETESLTQSLAEPALLLTPPQTASEEDDGLLTASEVAQLDLNADWVILSACNTAGAGDILGAEALSGLARAFFYAGARTLLVSHWYVDSDGAVKLTTRAISELRRDPKIGRAEALRRAMLALMADTSRPANWTPAAHPSVWAPFVVVGEGAR